jgi:hypothetical protein
MSLTVESLLEERRGYLLRGLKDRVAQVDAQIRLLGGVEVETVVSAPVGVETTDAAPVKAAKKR